MALRVAARKSTLTCIFLRSFCTAKEKTTAIARPSLRPNYLEMLYPNLSVPHTSSVPTQPSQLTDEEFCGFIPMECLQISHHVQSSNKPDVPDGVRTEVRVPIASADWIPAGVKEYFMVKHAARLTTDGFLLISSDRTRVAQLNLADCVDKLRSSIRFCADELKTQQVLEKETVAELREKQEAVAGSKLRLSKELASKLRTLEAKILSSATPSLAKSG